MERRLKANHCHPGFALPLVLILAVIGALFGAGSLLLFKYQCHRRIDRQHELEKVYAVRSAANYAKASFYIDSGKNLEYQTSSGRDLALQIKPVEALFPRSEVAEHLDISSKKTHFAIQEANQYCENQDYEYGIISNDTVIAVSSSQISYGNGGHSLRFTNVSSDNGARWWVNIGMKYTGGWLQGDFGRRFLCLPYAWDKEKECCMRLCLIRNVNNVSGENGGLGCQHGWPLRSGEKALVMEMHHMSGSSYGTMTLCQYDGQSGGIPIRKLENCPETCWMGMQVAGRNVCLFYVPNDLPDCGCVLSDVWEMPDVAGGVYRWLTANALEGESTDILRVVIECEVKGVVDVSNMNSVRYFKVTPAYQYDVFVKSPEWDDYERATVIQKHGVLSREDCYPKPFKDWNRVKYSVGFSLRSYDTHGTAWKGYKVRK